jgi:glycine/D-amino acid oxidase-like deaminating enzyme
MLPILGQDPESPSLIYACGHSRNGILLAPATAVAVRAIVEQATPAHSAIGRFSMARFAD